MSETSLNEQSSRFVNGNEPRTIIIGLDFGTTYSGVSWAQSDALDDIKVIAPSEDSFRGSIKVPSVISYDTSGKPARWGYDIKSSDVPLLWGKLLLDSHSSYDENRVGSKMMEAARCHMMRYGKSAVDIVSDYLRLLWQNALRQIETSLGSTVYEEALFRLVLTVPAIWNQNALTKMKLAARRAGLLDIRKNGETLVSFVSEPAAAALAAFHDLEIEKNSLLEVGDTFIVCDAGGGTVDLISYQITSFSNFQLTECIGATGDLCGAVYIDRAFESLLQKLRGKQLKTLDTSRRKMFFEDEWEYGLKRKFDGSDGPWEIEMPPTVQRRKSLLKNMFAKESSDILSLTGEQVREVFAAAVPKILHHIREQISGVKEMTGSQPKMLVLVGGFGSNRYLYQQIQQAFHGILIQRPKDACTAVCRGAVMKGIKDHRSASREPASKTPLVSETRRYYHHVTGWGTEDSYNRKDDRKSDATGRGLDRFSDYRFSSANNVPVAI